MWPDFELQTDQRRIKLVVVLLCCLSVLFVILHVYTPTQPSESLLLNLDLPLSVGTFKRLSQQSHSAVTPPPDRAGQPAVDPVIADVMDRLNEMTG